MGEELFVKLRYCFQGGYTLPQYCIDNGIKKPLFVMEKAHECFLQEVCAQFRYDKRILLEEFCFIDGETVRIPFKQFSVGLSVLVRNIGQEKFNYFGAIIFLTKKEYEIKSDKVISFDELEKFFVQRTCMDIPILHFLQRFPKVKFFITNFPNQIWRYKGSNKFGEQLPDAGELQRTLENNNGEHIKTLFDKFGYTNDEIIELLRIDKANKNFDGTTSLVDDNHPLKRIKDGKRETAYQPAHYRNKIYFFGPCYHFGRNAPFDKTIESYLQKMLNENDLPYCVENYGQAFTNRWQDMFYNLNALKFAPGDIIFFYTLDIRSNNDIVPFFDISDAFDPPHDYKEIFCTRAHVNELGYKLVAEKYFKFLTENNFFRDKEFNYPLPPPPCHRYGIPSWAEQGGVKSEIVSKELEAYKEQLKAKRVQIGALVMNCNPFTLGHQYLVEYAAARVDKLYLFVVEEDKSEFPFADRIELVRQGVKHLSNVEVLPSGKFIISQTTFSGYFSKAELQDVQVDSSEDVEIFGREIAPTLGITIRFAGEEPTDNVTRQYNETMKEILPRYGVEFCQIPRKEFDGEPISASKVRAALKVGDFDKIKKLVPKSTLQYLRKRTGQEVKEEPIVSDMTRQDLRSFIG